MKGDPLNIRILSGSGQIFQDFQGVYAFGRSEKAGGVSRVVDLERRSVKTQDSIRFWSDFSGLPRGLCFWKVREGGWRSERSQG